MIKSLHTIAYTALLALIMVLPLSAFMVPNVQAATGYVPLTPIQGLTPTPSDPNQLGNYIPNLVKFAIVIAGALAVLEIAVGGLQYVSTDAMSGKSEGKDRIKNAIYGLLLAIGSYIILYSINPGTLSLNLSISPIYKGPPTGQATTCPGGQTANPDGSCPTQNPFAPNDLNNKPWPDSWPGGALPTDASVRSQFANKSNFPISVGIWNNDCKTVGQASCTSLDGLSSSIISGLQYLDRLCQGKFYCGGAGTTILITGGTEFWLHNANGTATPTDPTLNTTDHRPGGRAVDIQAYAGITTLIKDPKNGGTSVPLKGNGCSALGTEAFSLNGAIYVHEDAAHWHICY